MKTIDVLVEELPKRGGWPDGAIGAGFLSGEGTLYFWDKNNDCPPKWTIDTDIEVEDSDEEVTREQYESALAAKNDGWIEWGGGKHPPVSTNTVVDVKFKNGNVQSGYPAGQYSWVHAWRSSNIIAYRLHKTKETELAEADDEADLNECIGQDAAPVWSGEGLPPVGCECEVSVDGGRSWCTYRAISEKNGARLIEIGNFTEEFQNNNWIFRPIRTEAERKRDAAVDAFNCLSPIELSGELAYDAIAAGKIPGVKLED